MAGKCEKREHYCEIQRFSSFLQLLGGWVHVAKVFRVVILRQNIHDFFSKTFQIALNLLSTLSRNSLNLTCYQICMVAN